MRVINFIKSNFFSTYQGPTIVLLFFLHLNQVILFMQRLNEKAFTFNGSIATIHNYLDQFANQNTLFEYKGYPTSNLQEYNPGPFPYMYFLKFSWLIHSKFDINPVYLSNLFITLYPTILILGAVIILYRNNLKILAITTASFTLIYTYLDSNFYQGYLRSDVFDTGVEHITLLTALTLLMVILSYKRPSSSHIPLLVYAGLLFHSHFLALALAPFAIIYAILLIFFAIKGRNYKANYFLLITSFAIIYFPIIFRFVTDPLYLYRAVKVNNPSTKHNQTTGFREEMEYFYETTPLGLYRGVCGENQVSNCISFDVVKVYLILLIIFSFVITFFALRRSNFFIKIIIVLSLLLININTINGYASHHSSVATGLTIAVLIYYISKYNKLVILLTVAALLFINFGERNLNNIYKENFSKDWIKSIKPHKFKIDICEISEVGICNKDIYNTKSKLSSSFFQIYGQDNHAQVSIMELLKNNIDICLYNDNLNLDRLEKLRCGKDDELDEKRYEIFFISGRQNMAPNIFDGYIKIGELIDRRVEHCIRSNEFSIVEDFRRSIKISPCFEPYGFNLTNESTSLYLKKESNGINMSELLNLSNLQIEKVMLQIEEAVRFREPVLGRCVNYKLKVCISENDIHISERRDVYQNIGELYDFR